jgi:hypothetical protein
VKKGLLVVALLFGATACLAEIKAGDKCNHPGETRLQEKTVFRCDVVPGETQKNFFGKEFPVSRWVQLEAK